MDFRWWQLSKELRWWVLNYCPTLRGLNWADQEVLVEVLQGKRPPPPLPAPGWRDNVQTLYAGGKFVAFAALFFLVFTLLTTVPVAVVQRLLGR